MPIAREGLREIVAATMLLGACVAGAWSLFWPAAIPFVVVWLWVLSFFRDPDRSRDYANGDLCAPADGTITEICELDHYESIGGPAVRIAMFLSLFNVHANRMPCSGRIRQISHRPGEFLDARHPESGRRNESNSLLIDPSPPMPGPVEVRQVSGVLARRIICHAAVDEHWAIGSRFGLIKFGSRTELIIPRHIGTEIVVEVGDKVKAGLTIVARQAIEKDENAASEAHAAEATC
ncbi:MAG: phosphatidylserine decarboxylase [Phycisphaerales bacterium]|nr:MAG: phosphatidylserine decarboxylase [Phycisphaerales bacterium]